VARIKGGIRNGNGTKGILGGHELGERELYKNFRCWEYWEKELEEWKMRLEVLGVIRFKSLKEHENDFFRVREEEPCKA